jgi:hypothetical protein
MVGQSSGVPLTGPPGGNWGGATRSSAKSGFGGGLVNRRFGELADTVKVLENWKTSK